MLQVASFVGNFLQVQTNTFITTSPISGYGDEVNKVINDHDCNLVIIPWHYGSYMDRAPEEISAIIRQTGVTTAMYINWKAAGNSWFTEVNQGFSRGILVPFAGGSDDREALKVAIRLQRSSGATLCVTHVVNSAGMTPHIRAQVQFCIAIVQCRTRRVAL
jgi:hypothetical protein